MALLRLGSEIAGSNPYRLLKGAEDPSGSVATYCELAILTAIKYSKVRALTQSQLSNSAITEGALKQYLGLGIGLLAGTFIGAAAVSGLHAQGKAPVYLVSEIDVTNPDAYGKEFAPKAQATIKAAGGKFVVIGGAGGA